MKARTVVAIAALGLAFGAACRHRSPTAVLHTLRPMAEKAERAQPFAAGVEVLPVRVPELLQRPQLVLPREAGSFAVSETHRWGNGLEADMQRVLVSNLSVILGSDSVVAFPAREGTKLSYRIGVDVLLCEARSGTLHFEARWTLSRPPKSEILLQRTVALQEPIKGGTADALVDAYDRVLAGLGREIANGIEAQAKAGP